MPCDHRDPERSGKASWKECHGQGSCSVGGGVWRRSQCAKVRCAWFQSPTETVGEEEVTLCKVEP